MTVVSAGGPSFGGLAAKLDNCLRRSGAGRSARFNLLLAPDGILRSLNRRFRKKDAIADVLSFAQGMPMLGDVALSISAAGRKARRSGLSVADEVLTLAVHGMLHLRGLDHATVRGYAVMRRVEESLLAPYRLRSGLERAAEEVE